MWKANSNSNNNNNHHNSNSSGSNSNSNSKANKWGLINTAKLDPKLLAAALSDDEDEVKTEEENSTNGLLSSSGSISSASSSFDPLLFLNSSKNFQTQMSVIESARFKAILEECVERLDMLGMMTSDSLRRRKDMQANKARKDIYQLMDRQHELESRYTSLIHQRNNLKGISNKQQYKQTQQQIKSITQSLKQNTSSITSQLKDQPTMVTNLYKLENDRSQLTHLLSSALSQLSYLSYDYLGHQVQVRGEEQRLLAETKRTQERTSEALKRLEEELTKEWQSFEQTEEQKNQTINQLTNQLKHLKKVTLLTLKYQQQTATAAQESLGRVRQQELNQKKENIIHEKNEIRLDKRVHKRNIHYLSKQKEEMDRMVEQWDQKYEKDYAEKSSQLSTLREKREADQVILIQKQTRWEDDRASKVSLMDELKRRESEEKEKARLDEVMMLAANKIRFAWKVFWRKRKKELKKLHKKHMSKIRAEKKAAENKR